MDMAIVASQLSGKENTTLSDFPNYSGHGSRYCIWGLLFPSSTLYQSQNMLIIRQIYGFDPLLAGYNEVFVQILFLVRT